MQKKILLCALSLLSSAWLLAAPSPRFDYQAIKDSTFIAKSVQGGRSLNDGEHYTTQSDGKILKFSYATGKQVDVLFDAATATPKLTFTNYQFSSDQTRILLTTDVKPIYRRTFTADFWVYNLQTKSLARLSEHGAQQVATFSPGGAQVGFVRENDLWVIDLEQGTESRLTSDGRFNEIINGMPDWVYEEELGLSRAFEWSPNGAQIAYLRFDESRVREYNMTRFRGELYPENYTFKYPKAGEENSVVEVYCHDLSTGTRMRMDVGSQTDQYIPRIAWTTSGKLLIYRANRAQNHLEVLEAKPDGSTQTIYQERNPRYLSLDGQCVTFLPDGDRFVVRSEKDGYTHLYLYSIKKGFLNRITSGTWEVTSLVGIEGETLYYLSTENGPSKRDLYRISLNGKGKRLLTDGKGTYSITPSKGFRYYLSYFSNLTTPTQVSLHTADGKLVRTLEDNAVLRTRLHEMQVPTKQLFSFTTTQNVTLNGYMIKPVDFDSMKRYPVFMVQYSGPGSQRVSDSWSMGWEDVLVQDGYVVVCVDGRGTGFRGEEFRKCTYLQLGRYEVEDQLETARYLGTLPYVDASRIGIYGRSYGGFMALNCILKGNDLFKMAIAVAPVTSWRFYDTIYTEAFNGRPQDNPAGYDDNSPIHFAERLTGKLLLAHGTGDDNVHIQNTYEMMSQFVEHNKPVELYIYPDQNHAMDSSRNHLMERCIEFVHRNL